MSCDHQCTFFPPSSHLRARCDLIVHNCVSIGFSFMQFFCFQSLMENCYIVFDSSAQFFCYAKNENFSRGTNDEKNFRFAGRVFAMKPFSLVHVNTQHFFLRLFGTNRNIKSGSLSLFSWLTVDWLEVGIFLFVIFVFTKWMENGREKCHMKDLFELLHCWWFWVLF